MRALPYTSPEQMARSTRVLLFAMLALLGLGTVMVYSATAVAQLRSSGPDTLLRPLASHALKLLLALLGFLLALRVGPRQLFGAARWAWAGGVVLLAAVLLLGVERNGARRWFELAGTSVQPSEIARVATIAMLAAWMSAARDRVQQAWTGVCVPFLLVALPAGLVLLEPDFGSAVFLLFMGVFVMWVGGARAQHLLCAFLPALAGAAFLGWTRFSHFRTRLSTFMNPDADYQVRQALSALGSGGLFGQGLGNGTGKWGFLPESDDDFLFAVVGEELGLVGTAAVLALYALLLWHGVRVLLGLRSRFSLVAGAGLLLQVVVQAVLNIAVVTAVAPNKGLPLPFVSAGGTSMVVLCISIGLLLGLARCPEEDPVLEARWAMSLTHRGEPGA
ncbi:MAG TPA: FtsW/RodA/SpoVE family cell cycle protein [Planctomycetota bacterium]|nr:FtsW/RodA/SpoVE family cell cycle protein [Planctomycetota bacterium]